MNFLKDAFIQLNGVDDVRRPTVQRPSALQAKDRALLSGLADFDASISEDARSSNPMRQDEVDAFTFRISQTSTIKGKALQDLSVGTSGVMTTRTSKRALQRAST